MKEYHGIDKEKTAKVKENLHEKIHLFFAKLVVELESFSYPLVYSSRDEKDVTGMNLTKTEDDYETTKMLKKS